ncbi:unnamed protein product [Parnassius apollo]|uniref:(apollo) hypothetical protein n=1 Tax=Parnassius apollo TaxID=110799 RepID=A0A8S3XS89_PARAO|nr:unnamed protein product [Parnassius apollo]
MLWDSKDPDHLNKSKREHCWRKISKEMKLPIPELRKLLDSLMGSYRREKSKQRKSNITDSGPSQQPTPSPQQPEPYPQEPTPSPQEPTPSPQEPTPSPQEPTPSLQEPSPSPQQPLPLPQPSRKKKRLNTNAQNDSLDNILKDTCHN